MSDMSSTDSARQVRPYDFDRHEGLDRGRLRRLNPILEVAAQRVMGAQTATLRTAVRVEVGELNQQRWEDYSNALPEPTFLASATVMPVGGRVALHVPLSLAMAVVEVRLGGEPTDSVPIRPLSDIELSLVGEFAQATLSESVQALSAVAPLMIGAVTSASNAVFVQAGAGPEVCLLVGLMITLGETSGYEATLCIPLSVLLPLLDAIERIDVAALSEPDSVAEEVRDRLLDAPVELVVSFPEIVLSPEELLSLAVGDVIPLHRPEGLPVRLSVAGVECCEVVPTSQGRRLACMVVESTHLEEK